MHLPLLNIKAQYAAIKPEVDAAIAEVMESQHFILGQKVEQGEEAVARYCGCSWPRTLAPCDGVITTPYRPSSLRLGDRAT
jgi:dTDP-4-amino-4,6-dideoxygalactose transaminase